MLQGDHHGELRHHLWRLKYTELNEIFAFMSLRAFAIALVSVFIPIYLYIVGSGLRGVLYFYFVMFLVELSLEYIVAVNIKKYGPKHLIAFSVPFLILHFWMLLTIQKYSWPIWLVAIVGGITLAFFWQSYHYDFSRAKHRKKASAEVGKLYITLAILGALAPFIGGIIADQFGISWVYGLVIGLLMFGVLTLFKTSDNNFRPGKVDFSSIKISEISQDMIAYGGSMIEACATVQIWPLFLFLIVGSYEKVGLITSVALLITVITTYIVSRKSDGKNRVVFIKTGGFLNGLASAFKIFITTIPQAFGINIAKSVAASIFSSPFVSEYYIHADERKRSEYIHLMESANDVAKIIFYGLLIALSIFLSDKSVLTIGLLLGALGAFVSMIMPPAKCEICGTIDNKEIKLSRRIR